MSTINVTVTNANPINATVSNATPINVTQTVLTGSTGVTSLRERTELEVMFKVAQASKYTEYTYSGSSLTNIDVWDDSDKGTKLFSKLLSYTGESLTGISITDEINSKTITKTLAYSAGALVNKTEVLV